MILLNFISIILNITFILLNNELIIILKYKDLFYLIIAFNLIIYSSNNINLIIKELLNLIQ